MADSTTFRRPYGTKTFIEEPPTAVTPFLLAILVAAGQPASTPPTVRRITVADQPAVEIHNDLVRLIVLEFGMRIVRFELVASGRNAYVFDEQAFGGYRGVGYLEGGEKEMLFPNETWPRNGVWDVPSRWEVVEQTKEVVAVRSVARARGVELSRTLTLRANTTAVSIEQVCTNRGAQARLLGISPHPELAVGGLSDAADEVFFYSDGRLERLRYLPGEPNADRLIRPERGVWGVHDRGCRETYVRAFEPSQLKSQYLFTGPGHYNAEEWGKPQLVPSGGSIRAVRSIFLLRGLPEVGEASPTMVAALVPRRDVFGEQEDAEVVLSVASPAALADVQAGFHLGNYEKRLSIARLSPGIATQIPIPVPVRELADGKHEARATVTAEGRRLVVSCVIEKNPHTAAQTRKLLAQLQTYLSSVPHADLRSRRDVRRQIRSRQVQWVLHEATRLQELGQIEACHRLLSQAARSVPRLATIKPANVVRWTLANESRGPARPVLRLVGRARYESPEGLRKGGHVYLFFDLDETAQLGGNAQRTGSPQDANHKDEVWLKPKGQVSIDAAIPQKGKYYPSLRLRQYGNSGPAIAIEVNGKELCRIKSGGGHLHWAKVKEPIELEAGPAKIVLRECRGSAGENVNMAMVDILALSTDPRAPRPNKTAVCPFDSSNKHWLPRARIPLVDPTLSMPGCTIRLKGTIEDGEPVWLFPDGTLVTSATLQVTTDGAPSAVEPGQRLAVEMRDAPSSSHKADLTASFADVRPLNCKPLVLSPNDDGVSDRAIVTSPIAPRSAQLRDAITGETQPIPSRGWREDGSLVWPGSERPVPSFYEIAVPSFIVTPRAVGVVRVTEEPALAYAEPRRFSPNGDGVLDAVSFIVQLPVKTTARARVTNSKGDAVRQIGVLEEATGKRTFDWDGKDDAGEAVTNGDCRFELVRNDGRVTRSTAAAVDSFRQWARAPIHAAPDFFPIGVYYTPGRHPEGLTGLAYHDALFQDLRAHRMNTILTGLHFLPTDVFDLAGKHGIRIIPSLSSLAHGRLPIDEREAARIIEQKIASVRRHPALLAYYVSDEPQRGQHEMAARVDLMHRILEGLDPVHPPISCLIGIENIAHYYTLLKPPVFFIDIYPLLPKAGPGDFRRMYYTQWDLTEYVNLARGNLKDDRPLWTVLQAHNFDRWLRRPTPVEVRSQIGLSLAYGAKGILFFLYQPLAEMIGLLDYDFKPTPNYEEAGRVCARVQRLAPLLLRLRALEPVVRISGEPANPHFARVTGTFRGPESALFLIVANTYVEGESEVILTFEEPMLKVGALVDVETDDRIPVNAADDRFVAKLGMRPGDFRIFRLEGTREAKPLRSWCAMSPEEQMPTRNRPRSLK